MPLHVYFYSHPAIKMPGYVCLRWEPLKIQDAYVRLHAYINVGILTGTDQRHSLFD